MTEAEIKHKKDLLYVKVQEAYRLAMKARQKWTDAQKEYYDFLLTLDVDP